MSSCCPRKLLCVAIALALAGAPAAAMAQSRDDRAPRSDALSETVRMAERDSRGEVLSAERVQYDGRDMHRVKVVDNDGRVRVYLREPNQRQQQRAPAAEPRGRGGDRGRGNQRGNPTRGDDG